MSFKQTFSRHKWRLREEELGELLNNETYLARENCSVDELDSFYSTMTKRDKCAIIGNGGILLNSHCGRDIDTEYDYVIRANLAKLRGYTSDVGSKTTLMLMNGEATRQLFSLLTDPGNFKTTEFNETILDFHFLNDTILWFGKSTAIDSRRPKKSKLWRLLYARRT